MNPSESIRLSALQLNGEEKGTNSEFKWDEIANFHDIDDSACTVHGKDQFLFSSGRVIPGVIQRCILQYHISWDGSIGGSSIWMVKILEAQNESRTRKTKRLTHRLIHDKREVALVFDREWPPIFFIRDHDEYRCTSQLHVGTHEMDFAMVPWRL